MATNTEELTAGDIITIENFDLPDIGDTEKRIWCIYMGMDSILDYPIYVYFCRTTTQKEDFEKGGNRDGHKFIEFSKGQYGFEKTCLLDLNERPKANITQEKFNSYIITKKGRLPDFRIKEIFNKCLTEFLLPRQLKSVRDSLAQVGIYIKNK
ncbi:MAG: hypothetical protein FWH53_02005 [Leptospirales bacterium]|nr:hypothetical protein [Leptospirales bacterium]